MRTTKVLLLGGSGFIGSAVAGELTKGGYEVTVPTRQRERAKHLLLLPTCDVVDTNAFDRSTLDQLIRGQDVVINLIGILHGNFEFAHVRFPQMVAECCAANNVNRLLQMSALNADPSAPSEYLRSRGRGEAAVLAIAKSTGLAVTIFRPSVVFGEGDHFLNMFAMLAKTCPIIPLGSPDALFQVVWVEDVARALVRAITMPATVGKTYPLVGTTVYTLRQLLAYVITQSGSHCKIISLGTAFSRLQATLFEFLPGKLITRDNLASMSLPSTSPEPFPTIFGAPAAMEAVVPGYMNSRSGRAHYAQLRQGLGK